MAITNQEKAREICGCEWLKQQGECLGEEECHECSINNEYYYVMAMAKWKDEQNKWHKITDGDLPIVSCYIIAVYDVDDYTEGSSRFIHEVFYDAEQKNFSDAYKDELNVIAWRELPKYEEE